MVGGSNQNELLIQIDASSFAEFEISEFEIARVNCTIQCSDSQCDPRKADGSDVPGNLKAGEPVLGGVEWLQLRVAVELGKLQQDDGEGEGRTTR